MAGPVNPNQRTSIQGLLRGMVNVIDSRMLRQGNRIGTNLKRAGAFILRNSQKIVPVWTGNLKASGYVSHTGSGLATVVDVGYRASYAVFVHENEEALHGRDFNEVYADKIAENPGHHYWFNRGEWQQANFLVTIIKTRNRDIRAIMNKGVE